jgi:proline-specific peptidase
VTSAGGLVRLDDTSLFVEERGSGSAVIVLHGGPGLDHNEFADYLDPLADSYRLLLVDQRAQGRSDEAPKETWTLERMAQDVIMLARALGLGPYAVLGHSFGAFVALRNAIDYPGMATATIVSSGIPSMRWLVAVERNLEVLEPAEIREQVKASLDRESTAQTAEEVAELIADQMPFHFADPLDLRIPDYIDRTKDTVLSPAMLRLASGGGPLDVELEARLAEVSAPTLILVGRYDRACAPEASEAMAKAIPRSQLHVFEHSGHMTFVEEPQQYVEVVRAFLSQHLP